MPPARVHDGARRRQWQRPRSRAPRRRPGYAGQHASAWRVSAAPAEPAGHRGEGRASARRARRLAEVVVEPGVRARSRCVVTATRAVVAAGHPAGRLGVPAGGRAWRSRRPGRGRRASRCHALHQQGRRADLGHRRCGLWARAGRSGRGRCRPGRGGRQEGAADRRGRSGRTGRRRRRSAVSPAPGVSGAAAGEEEDRRPELLEHARVAIGRAAASDVAARR